MDGWSGAPIRGRLLPPRDERDDDLVNEAALLPGPEESHGEIRRFRLAPRLTAHVRHQAKYLDMPVSEEHWNAVLELE